MITPLLLILLTYLFLYLLFSHTPKRKNWADREVERIQSEVRKIVAEIEHKKGSNLR